MILLKIPELGPGYQLCPVSTQFMLKPLLYNRFVEQKGCKRNLVEAGGLYKVSALCETFYNRNPGCKPIGVIFEALLEPET